MKAAKHVLAVTAAILMVLPAQSLAAPHSTFDPPQTTFEPAMFVNAVSILRDDCNIERHERSNLIWFEVKREGKSWKRFEPQGVERGKLPTLRQNGAVVSRRTIRAPAPKFFRYKDGVLVLERVKLRLVAKTSVTCGPADFRSIITRRLVDLEPNVTGSHPSEYSGS
jgi:hypothetical protein